MREVIAAIREGLPDADQMQPGAVFQHVLGALHDCSKNTQKRTVLFAPAEFVNDTKGRFYNCMAKSLAFQFCTF